MLDLFLTIVPRRMASTGLDKGSRREICAAKVYDDVRMEIRSGLTGTAELMVGEEHTAPRIGSGKVHVLATPVMINLIEAAALDAIERFLPAGFQSLGTVLNVRHIAATPVGMRVRATAEVMNTEGRTVFFKVEARDEKDLIGDGTHERVVVNVAKFDERVQRKLRP